jgi:hypothetical protein
VLLRFMESSPFPKSCLSATTSLLLLLLRSQHFLLDANPPASLIVVVVGHLQDRRSTSGTDKQFLISTVIDLLLNSPFVRRHSLILLASLLLLL